MLSPADVLIIIPAVTLLLAKEQNYFVAGEASTGSGQKNPAPWRQIGKG
jgi:hypothetical protein